MNTKTSIENDRPGKPSPAPSGSEFVPYAPKKRGETDTAWMSLKLSNGATVQVGHQPKRKDGEGYVHRFLMPRPDGKIQKLEFCLTREACLALVNLYFSHGVATITATLSGNIPNDQAHTPAP